MQANRLLQRSVDALARGWVHICYKVGVGYLHSVHDGHSQMHEHALADAARALPRVRPLTPAVTTTPRMLTAPDA